MSVYGDVLLAWPEQVRTIVVYDMVPQLPGGWTAPDNALRVRGVLQHTGGRQLKDLNGNLAAGENLEFWSWAEGLDGKFTMAGGDVFRLMGDTNWQEEGGFYRYSLQKVIGNNGTESDQSSWNTGADNFG